MTEAEKETNAITESEESLRALVAEHESRLDEVAELVARVRHEINNPLAGVLGQAQLLLREELSEKARQACPDDRGLAKRLRMSWLSYAKSKNGKDCRPRCRS